MTSFIAVALDHTANHVALLQTNIPLLRVCDVSCVQVVTVECGDKRDPGYWSTSRMLLESGLCLALQNEECNRAGSLAGGVLTPATGMGMVLVQRLRDAGFRFEVTGTAEVTAPVV